MENGRETGGKDGWKLEIEGWEMNGNRGDRG